MAAFILKWRIPLLIIVAAIFIGLKVSAPPPRFDNSVESMLDPHDPALATLHEFRDIFGSEEDIFVGIAADDVFSPTVLSAIGEISEAIAELDNVDDVVSITTAREMVGTEDELLIQQVLEVPPTSLADRQALRDRVLASDLFANQLISLDGTVASMIVRTRIPDPEIVDGVDFRAPLTQETRRIVAGVCGRHASIDACHVVGPPIVKMDLVEMSQRDQWWFLPVSAVLIISFLALVFRSVIAVLASSTAVFVSLQITQSLLLLSGRLLNMVTVIITPLILVIGLTATIHLISRYGELMRSGASKQRALREAIRHVGLAGVLTSVTTAAGFLSLTVSPVVPIREFGVIAAVGILITLVVCMTTVPAALSLLPIPRFSDAIVGTASWTGRLVSISADLISRRRPQIWLCAAILAGLALVGVFRVEVETILIRFFPADHPLHQAYMFVDEELSGVSPVEILFEAEEVGWLKEPKVLSGIEQYRSWLASRPEPGKVVGLTDFVKALNRAMHADDPAAYVIPETRAAIAQYLLLYESAASGDREPEIFTYVTEDYATARLSARLHLTSSRDLVAFAHELSAFCDDHPIDSVQVRVTGAAILYANMVEKLVASQIRSFGLALVVIFLVMILLFRSFKVGVVSMIPNLIPIFVAAGVMGWAGFNLTVSTAMIASVAIGIAVDDTIHFLVRFKHEHDQGLDYLEACRRTLLTTGRPVIFTSLVITAGFLVLIVSSFRPNIEFGVLTAVAMISAMIADLTVTPAALIRFEPMERPKKPR